MADDNVKPSGFRPFFGVILTMEKRWTDMKTGGWKFFPSLQILSSWWIISFERPDLPRGLDPCYRAEEPSREEEETEKKKRSCENGPANYRHWRYILIWCTLQKRWNDLRNWNIALHMSILARSRKYQIAHQYDFFIIVLELSVSRQLL